MYSNDPVFSQKERNIIILIIIILLGAILAYAVRGIFGALLGTLVMYTLFRNLNIFLIERCKWPKSVSSISIIILSIFIVVIPFVGMVSMLFKKAVQIQKDPQGVGKLITAVNKFAGDKFGKPDWIEDQLQSSAAYLGGLMTSVLGGAANIFIEIAVMYFILYYVFANYKEFERSVTDFLPFNDDNIVVFGKELKNITYLNVIGQTIIALAQGMTLSLGLWIFGSGDPLFWGAMCAILSFIPLFGPPFIFVPAALILLSKDMTWQAVGLLIWGFGLVINIDNVLRLILSRKIGNIHPIITIVGVIIGIPLFGFVGLVFGPLLLAYFLITIRIFKANKSQSLKRKMEEGEVEQVIR